MRVLLLVACLAVTVFGYPRRQQRFDKDNGFDDYMNDNSFYDTNPYPDEKRDGKGQDVWKQGTYGKQLVDPNSVWPDRNTITDDEDFAKDEISGWQALDDEAMPPSDIRYTTRTRDKSSESSDSSSSSESSSSESSDSTESTESRDDTFSDDSFDNYEDSDSYEDYYDDSSEEDLDDRLYDLEEEVYEDEDELDEIWDELDDDSQVLHKLRHRLERRKQDDKDILHGLDVVEEEVWDNEDKMYDLEDKVTEEDTKIEKLNLMMEKMNQKMESLQNLVETIEEQQLPSRPTYNTYKVDPMADPWQAVVDKPKSRRRNRYNEIFTK